MEIGVHVICLYFSYRRQGPHPVDFHVVDQIRITL